MPDGRKHGGEFPNFSIIPDGIQHTIILIKPDRLYLSMKTLIEVHKEGKYFVAVDLLTNVADQRLSEEEAVRNLRKGLEEHYFLKNSFSNGHKGEANPLRY